jgi:hypothetical protein
LLVLNPVIDAPKVTVNVIELAFEYVLPAVMVLIVVGGIETVPDGMFTFTVAALVLVNTILPE